MALGCFVSQRCQPVGRRLYPGIDECQPLLARVLYRDVPGAAGQRKCVAYEFDRGAGLNELFDDLDRSIG